MNNYINITIMKLMNGISTIEGDTQFVVLITDKDGQTNVIGTCDTKQDATLLVIRVGKHELQLLNNKTDEKWTNNVIEFENDSATSYMITTQKLGRFMNGKVDFHCNIYYEEVSRISPIDYDTDKDKSESKDLVKELLEHPLTYKEN